MTDVIVIGAGLNGLVVASLLARQKRSVILLDQRPVVGGAAITTELAPGFHVPALSHALGPVAREVVRALRLDRAGLEFLTPDPALTTLTSDRHAIMVHRDDVLTAASINTVSSKDAGRWMDFKRTLHRIASLVARLDRMEPPSPDGIASRNWWKLIATGRHARGLD